MKGGSNVTPALAAEHGLTEEEFDRAVGILGHTPNMTELGIFSVMWSASLGTAMNSLLGAFL